MDSFSADPRPSTSQRQHQQQSRPYTAPGDSSASSSSAAAQTWQFAFQPPSFTDSSLFSIGASLPSSSSHAALSEEPTPMATDHWAPPAPSRPGSRRAASSRQGGARIQHAKWEGSDMDTWVREMNGIKVVRRADGLVNGTKLLNCTKMTRGRRDGILKNEKHRTVVKVGSHVLKGVWIPVDRARELAQKYGLDDLWPLLEPDIAAFQAAEGAFETTSQQSEASSSSRPSSTGSEMPYNIQSSTGTPRPPTSLGFARQMAQQHQQQLSKSQTVPQLVSNRHHSFSGPSSQHFTFHSNPPLLPVTSTSPIWPPSSGPPESEPAHGLASGQPGFALPSFYSFSESLSEEPVFPSTDYTPPFSHYTQPPLVQQPSLSSTPSSHAPVVAPPPPPPLLDQDANFASWYPQSQTPPAPQSSGPPSQGSNDPFQDFIYRQSWRPAPSDN